jgi:serine/threonine protein phosphatase PrpC
MLTATKLVERGGAELQDRAEFFWHGANLFVILADGAGGLSGGAEAAEYVVNEVREAILTNDLNLEKLGDFLTSLDRQMAAANTFGETTCVIVMLTSENVTGISVGDSGAWIISPSGVENLTANQHRKPLIGSGCALPVGFSRERLMDTLLVASDGLLKYASTEQIALKALSSDLKQAAQSPLELVRYPSGALPDDVSILLARDA